MSENQPIQNQRINDLSYQRWLENLINYDFSSSWTYVNESIFNWSNKELKDAIKRMQGLEKHNLGGTIIIQPGYRKFTLRVHGGDYVFSLNEETLEEFHKIWWRTLPRDLRAELIVLNDMIEEGIIDPIEEK
jgi:hypothetical protein